jgi:hypothetical protein
MGAAGVTASTIELAARRKQRGASSAPPVERAQILTNLGNQLDRTGRLVEAGEYWSRANRGTSAIRDGAREPRIRWYNYARAYYNSGHQTVFLYRAHQSLSAALAKDADWARAPDGARDFFIKLRKKIAKMINVKRLDKDLKLDGYGLGRSHTERAYRQWALNHTLFLNPLNDLGPDDIAAQDVLSLPSLTRAT